MKPIFYVAALSCAVSCYAFAASAAEITTGIVEASYSLPKHVGGHIRHSMKKVDEENAQLKQQMDVDHAELYAIVTAPTFDRDAFVQKTADLRVLQDEAKQNRDEAFADAIGHLSPENRRTLASALESRLQARDTDADNRKTTAKLQQQDSEEIYREQNYRDISPAMGGTLSRD